MTTPSWLSVLVPAYHAETFIVECLESILAQAGDGVEVIAIDDGSADATPTLLAECRRRHPERLRVYAQATNRGVAQTRDALVAAARGDYLWFVDADDRLYAGAIDGLHGIVRRHAPDLVLCDYRRNGRLRERRGSTFTGPSRTILTDASTILAGLFEAGQLHPWSKISRRSLWDDSLRFPAGRFFEDVSVMPRLACRAATAYHAPEAWVFYRQWGGSIVATMNPGKCIDLVRASAEFPADVRRRGVQLSGRAWFAARHYAARHFVRAMRHLDAASDPDACRRTRGVCMALFLEAIDDDIGWLQRQYVRRGWLGRWARLMYWLRVARRDADGFPGDTPRAAAA